jgi:hypothetical protein
MQLQKVRRGGQQQPLVQLPLRQTLQVLEVTSSGLLLIQAGAS